MITHGHGDHFGGIQAFIDEGDNPQVWGRKGALGETTGFNIEARAGKMAGLTYANARGARQAGIILPDSIHINNGVAPRPDKKRTMFTRGEETAEFSPTHFFTGERKKIEIDGISFELVAASGETYDNMYIWMPERKSALYWRHLLQIVPQSLYHPRFAIPRCAKLVPKHRKNAR